MKYRVFLWIAAIASFAPLAIPVRLAAQAVKVDGIANCSSGSGAIAKNISL
jgi:hypothetical protein